MTNKQSVFNVREIPTLDLDLGCIVEILNGDVKQVKVTIDASDDDLKDFEVSQSGNTVSVRQKGASSNGGGMNIIGGNISIGNIRQSVVSSRDYVAPKVTIFAPKANLEAKFSRVLIER
jgi:hypothetical protein